MHRFKIVTLATVLLGAVAPAAPASADWCIQLSGALSGAPGFFRFRASPPRKTGEVTALNGRVAGLSPVFGTAVRAKDNSFVEIGATFFSDMEQGQFDVTLDPPTFTTGSGGAELDSFGVDGAVTVAVVSCDLEP